MSIIRSEKFSKLEKVYPFAMLIPALVFAVGAVMQWKDEPFFAFFDGVAAVMLFLAFLWLISSNKILKIVLAAGIAITTVICIVYSVMNHKYIYILASLVLFGVCILTCGKYTEEQALKLRREQYEQSRKKKGKSA